MSLLLDTQVFLWFVWGAVQLSSTAPALIENQANRKSVSAACIWEIAIKFGIGKLTLAKPLDRFIADGLDGNGFGLLTIERAHFLQVAALPQHHRDPFDRMLIAQAMVEQMPLLSADSA